MQSILTFAHSLLEIIQEGDTVIDATVGNGHDTLFLAKKVGNSGCVHGFDIQKQAIDTTLNKLKSENVEARVSLHHTGHEHIDQVLSEADALHGAIFNLGFLPKGDKEIITKAETTLKALQQCLDHLTCGGRIVIVLYYGHPGGEEEKNAVEAYCQQLDQHYFDVLSYRFINQVNQPPYLLCIERKREGGQIPDSVLS